MLALGNVRGFAFTLGLTTLIDVLVVFMFTKPMVTLLARTRFFGGGHRLSGFDAGTWAGRRYAGRGQVRRSGGPGPEPVEAGAAATIADAAERDAPLSQATSAAGGDRGCEPRSTSPAGSPDAQFRRVRQRPATAASARSTSSAAASSGSRSPPSPSSSRSPAWCSAASTRASSSGAASEFVVSQRRDREHPAGAGRRQRHASPGTRRRWSPSSAATASGCRPVSCP